MNHDRAQLAKLGQTLLSETPSLSAVHCVHCGRVYIVSAKNGRESCDCGAELYPVSKDVTLAQELRGGDATEIRAVVTDKDKLWQLCRAFVENNKISCPETVYQSDHVIEHGYDFITEVCKIVGFHTPLEDDE